MKKEREEIIGQRVTWQRKAILEVLHDSGRPVSAEHIHEVIFQTGRQLNLSTIYRTLQTLEQNNAVHRLVPGNDKKALFSLHGRGCNTHILICRKCGKQQLMRKCPLESMKRDVSESSFLIECHHLELRGLCKQCR